VCQVSESDRAFRKLQVSRKGGFLVTVDPVLQHRTEDLEETIAQVRTCAELCVCVCVCARARACARTHMHAPGHVRTRQRSYVCMQGRTDDVGSATERVRRVSADA
jgi:hypothetical protein